MTDEQILKLICDNTGKRINLPNFTLDELKDFARAVLAAADLEARNRVTEALGLPGNGLRDGKRVSFAWEYLLGLIADMAKDDEPVTARN